MFAVFDKDGNKVTATYQTSGNAIDECVKDSLRSLAPTKKKRAVEWVKLKAAGHRVRETNT